MNKINIKSEKTFDRVLKYIDDQGFGIPQMPLSKHLSKEQFEKNYYDKSELISFCREQDVIVWI